MKRRLTIGLAVLLPAALVIAPTWAIDEGPSAAPPAERPTRQREGGHSIPRGDRAESQEATEDGFPESGARAFDFERPERIRPGTHWRLGVFARNTPTGVVIQRVMPGSPASRVGLEPGDRIVTVSGFQIGIVGNQLYYLGEELQRQADFRGNVLLLVQNVRNNRLLNLEVQLERRRFGYPIPSEPGAERLGVR